MRPPSRSASLAVTLGIALVVKVAILTMLHAAFFSQPQAKKMRVPTEQVEQHLLTPVPISAPKEQP